MSFPAKFPGVCSECESRFAEGVLIESFRVNGQALYRHAGSCPDDPDLSPAAACANCHLVHAKNQKECA